LTCTDINECLSNNGGCDANDLHQHARIEDLRLQVWVHR